MPTAEELAKALVAALNKYNDQPLEFFMGGYVDSSDIRDTCLDGRFDLVAVSQFVIDSLVTQ